MNNHAADQAAKINNSPANNGVLQRKTCACGRPIVARGECAECRKKRHRLQRRAVNESGPAVAPPIVHEVLRSPGQPLDSATRTFMEPRFGHDFSGVQTHTPTSQIARSGLTVDPVNDYFEREADRVADSVMRMPEPNASKVSVSQAKYNFSQVRVHTDARAAESARAVNALAYTVGQNIVFGEGQYMPNTPMGKHLLAHELTHTLQQAKSSDTLQRFVSCSVVTMSGENCPPREAGEAKNSEELEMVPLAYDGHPSLGIAKSGQLVSNFAIGESSVKADLASNYYWNEFIKSMIANPDVRWEILGFTDCQGSETTNQSLREKRAKSLYDALPSAAQKQIIVHKAAPINDCIADNSNKGGRVLNRSALVRKVETNIEFEDEEAEPVETEKAKFVCGPDVTKEMAKAITGLRSTFSSFSSEQKEESCDALISYPVGLVAWDIVDLCDKCKNGNIWISRDHRPPCATRGAKPACGPSVQVGDQCFFSGSANYVIYGVMFKLCSAIDNDDFNQSEMESWIWFYKTRGGTRDADANLETAKAWARAGYSGWSGGSAPTSGDRSNCRPLCPSSYSGPTFQVRWCPDLDPDGLCAKSR